MEQIMTGISVLSANLVETKRATATMMTSAPKTIFVETTTASSSGNRQIQKLIVASQVDLQSVSPSLSCQLLDLQYWQADQPGRDSRGGDEAEQAV